MQNKTKESVPEGSRKWAWWMAVLGMLVYSNTFNAGYVLDDRLVYIENEAVLSGAKGLKQIFTQDSYQGFYDRLGVANNLEGGRYRPLSIASFALEMEVVKRFSKSTQPQPRLSHGINILLYGLTGFLLYGLFAHIFFREHPGICLFFTALFLVHPLHTEVVANVKSRDELLSLIGIFCLLRLGMLNKQGVLQLGLVAIVMGLTLLAKEYAILLLVLFPILAWVKEVPTRNWLKVTGAMGLSTIVYLVARSLALGRNEIVANTDPIDNPFALMSGLEQICTQIWALGYDLKLLLWPARLSYDYTFNQIPAKGIAHPEFILAFALYAIISIWFVVMLFKRKQVAFGLGCFLAFLLIISNLLVPTGVLIGERFLYHASFGFILVLAEGARRYGRLWARIPPEALQFVLCGLLVVLGLRSLVRNENWRNEFELYTHDVALASNSARANNNAAVRHYEAAILERDPTQRKKQLDLAMTYLEKATDIHDRYRDAWLNRGLLHFEQNQLDEADAAWEKAGSMLRNHPVLLRFRPRLSTRFTNQGIAQAKQGDLQKAEHSLTRATTLDPSNPLAWHHLGGVFHTRATLPLSGRSEKKPAIEWQAKAEECWTNAKRLWPESYKPWQSFGIRP